MEVAKILQTVTQIQASVNQLQSNGGNSQGGSNNEETERILTQTQEQLQTLAKRIEGMQVSPTPLYQLVLSVGTV